jgi:hypothetical protein
MFEDDKIGRQSTYEQFHRTRPVREPHPSQPGTLPPENTDGHGWPPERDRFAHYFKPSARLW